MNALNNKISISLELNHKHIFYVCIFCCNTIVNDWIIYLERLRFVFWSTSPDLYWNCDWKCPAVSRSDFDKLIVFLEIPIWILIKLLNLLTYRQGSTVRLTKNWTPTSIFGEEFNLIWTQPNDWWVLSTMSANGCLRIGWIEVYSQERIYEQN